jgi:hypothetical protein
MQPHFFQASFICPTDTDTSHDATLFPLKKDLSGYMSKADLTKMNFVPTHEKYVSVMLHKDCVSKLKRVEYLLQHNHVLQNATLETHAEKRINILHQLG